MRRARLVLLAGAAALLTGCTASARASDPTWVPSPNFGSNGEGPGVGISPIVPVPSLTPGTTPPSGGSGAPSSGSSGTGDPAVVATHLQAPVGLTMLPDNTALVGERTTGRIVRVQPKPGLPVPTVRTIPGLDATGDGGLLDLALSPSYDQDNLIYAYITTKTDNRVVDFTLSGPVTPVLTGIPKGRTGNTGRITFGADGDLYVGTGDTGRPALASNPKSLAGKVLRVTDIGKPAPGNPSRTAIWTSGHHVVNGLCPVPATKAVLEVETRGTAGLINSLVAGGSYGWPTAAAGAHSPAATLPAADSAPGGCAVAATRVFVTSLDGHALLAAPVTAGGTTVVVGALSKPMLANKYGRLKTVVAAADGALWLTTSNRDGRGTPVADDERVIRYVPAGGGGATSSV